MEDDDTDFDKLRELVLANPIARRGYLMNGAERVLDAAEKLFGCILSTEQKVDILLARIPELKGSAEARQIITDLPEWPWSRNNSVSE